VPLAAKEAPAVEPDRAQVGAWRCMAVHGKHRLEEASGPLRAYELAERVGSPFSCPHHKYPSLPAQQKHCSQVFLK
jgi:hypothetical protein